eukprot:scaffold16776_cov71-Phaeocystis_antarctica.AAC.3
MVIAYLSAGQHGQAILTMALLTISMTPPPHRSAGVSVPFSPKRCGDRAGGRDAGPLERYARACGAGSRYCAYAQVSLQRLTRCLHQTSCFGVPSGCAHVCCGMRAVGWGRKLPHMNQPLTLIILCIVSLAPTFHLYTHFWANGSVCKNKGGDTTTRTEIETAGSGKDLGFWLWPLGAGRCKQHLTLAKGRTRHPRCASPAIVEEPRARTESRH